MFTLDNTANKTDNPLQQGHFNFKKADWTKFSGILTTLTSQCSFLTHQKGYIFANQAECQNYLVTGSSNYTEYLDLAAQMLTDCISEAALASIPVYKEGFIPKPWWNEELTSLRKEMVQAQKELKASKEDPTDRKSTRLNSSHAD